MLIVTDSIRPTLKRWILAISASVLLHLIILLGISFELPTGQRNPKIATKSIEVILLKTTLQTEPIIEQVKAAKQVPIKTNERYLRNAQSTESLKKDTAKRLHSVQEKMITNERSNQLNRLENKVDLVDKSLANHHPKQDWNNIAKEVIRDNFDKETLRNQRQGKLWLKSPSVMFGKPRDFFDKQDKRAMLADTNESNKKSIFPAKKPKNANQIIKIGKLCFSRPTVSKEEDIRAGRSVIGMLIPVSCYH